ncbi:PilW family protein [Halomonas urumqiensis]|uniref:Prepilin-type cleavage/methylation domain-containing protein n=1 Tax=Halomonas urumqiensis TaxID=1684789 RepID=A0A2N7UI82_9GAMM|nr:prepilin-type N-terminal cleavage/methylation domain-containing protein [Halomonas urumqiensis]PMR80123.1 hypothetical protein C1H70_09930 [Halomonas urumqiensis]PTB01242.1 prepilin-type N-terminal cleavage/methylation domain-containing protein [Halomonas urumqiensis]GHE22607.1 hypothetical protein GCM10017767_31280 [Halomonas urumqiensis]
MKKCLVLSRRSAGFTLVELMVALVIGLIIVLGAGQLFLMGKQSYDRVAELANRQESLRYLADIVSLDIRTATTAADADDGERLVLNYGAGVRPDDVYCSGDELVQVQYALGQNTVTIEIQCEGEALSVPNSLIEGVTGLNFGSADPQLIEVEVEFEPMRGESAEYAAYSFVVARREEILSRF